MRSSLQTLVPDHRDQTKKGAGLLRPPNFHRLQAEAYMPEPGPYVISTRRF